MHLKRISVKKPQKIQVRSVGSPGKYGNVEKNDERRDFPRHLKQTTLS